MNIKTIKLEKKDVEKLSTEELEALGEWAAHPGFPVAARLGEEFLARRALDMINSAEGGDFIEIGKAAYSIAQNKIGIDFFLDAAQRAKEEIKERAKE